MVRNSSKKLLGELGQYRDEIYWSYLRPSSITKEAHLMAEKILKDMFEMQPSIRSIAVMMAVIAILRGYLMKPLRMYFECHADIIMKDILFTFDQDHWMDDGGSIASAITHFLYGKKYPHDPFEELEKNENR
jgi:hypothetical protein